MNHLNNLTTTGAIKYYTVNDVSQILHLSRAKTYELFRRADFPSFRVGTRWLVSDTNLAQWADAQTNALSECY